MNTCSVRAAKLPVPEDQPVHIGYRAAPPDQPKSLSVIGIRTYRVPYRRIGGLKKALCPLGGRAQMIQF
jgi:hypothetical protein